MTSKDFAYDQHIFNGHRAFIYKCYNFCVMLCFYKELFYYQYLYLLHVNLIIFFQNPDFL